MTTMSPGGRVSTRHWRTYSTKIALVHRAVDDKRRGDRVIPPTGD
jgi:hypothetical protein